MGVDRRNRRAVARRTAPSDLFAAMVGIAVIMDVMYPGPVIVGAITGHADSNAVEVIVAALLIVVTIVLLREVLTTRTPWTLSPERSELAEERRAWLTDLRTEGAPWHERLAHKLSLVLVAAPVMTVRRWTARTTLAQRIGGVVGGMGTGIGVNLPNAGFEWWFTPAMFVIAAMLGDLTTWILTRLTTRQL
jgi:hypothetical protein